MYSESFYIEEDVWNNAFSFDKRINKRLFVPSLKKIESFDEIKLWKEIVFEDFDFDWILQSCTGLENFYEIDWKGKQMYLFDNHNHALYFWYLACDNWIIWENNLLYHVDEHSDMRDPREYLLKPDSYDLEKVFNYTNFSRVNVGNYIIPAQKDWLISDIVQIRNEDNLLDYNTSPLSHLLTGEGVRGVGWASDGNNVILNLDLDFFQPDLDFIDYDLKKKVVLDIASKASLITVATSPFFINQTLALKVFKDLFN